METVETAKKQSFVRYEDFDRFFKKEVDLKIYTQDNVTSGKEGDYELMLNTLKNACRDNLVRNNGDIIAIMLRCGIKASAPGLSQVLKGLGIIVRKDGYYIFKPYKVTKALALWVFQYNHWKQKKVLNARTESDLANKDRYHALTGKFEMESCGKDTYITKTKREPKVQEPEMVFPPREETIGEQQVEDLRPKRKPRAVKPKAEPVMEKPNDEDIVIKKSKWDELQYKMSNLEMLINLNNPLHSKVLEIQALLKN
jgi:hypothetical protein